jgi:signal transduction histidine kinase
VFLLITLQPAAMGLGLLFQRSISRGAISELTADLRLIADSLELDEAGSPKLSEAPAHPRFLLAFGGRYWQVSEDGKPILRSPSLWDQSLEADVHPETGQPPALARFSGPSDQALLGLVQRVVSKGATRQELEIITAIDQAEILDAQAKFEKDIWIGVAGFAALFLLAASVQVYFGLAPLHALRSSVAAVRSGDASRIEGAFPDEIMPLIQETNALLNARDQALETAQARAGNLAHGLKTPLAIMAAQSRLIRRSGHGEFADEVDKQIESMRWHVERELVLARDRGGLAVTPQVRLDTGKQLLELVAALKKLPLSSEIEWRVSVAPQLHLAINHADFSDIMGNILENALKWAGSRISVDARRAGALLVYTIDDDGHGVAEEEIERILRRGERADPSVPGSGLGLAIVSELVSLYGGRLDLSRSNSLGGLRVAITLAETHTDG